MKNFKLLLATTAILSTGALAVMAADPVKNTSTTGANLNASIQIYSPITVEEGSIVFPTITSKVKDGADSVKVKVNHDGTIDYTESNAQIMDESKISITPMRVSGSAFSTRGSSFEGKTGTNGGFGAISLSANEISMDQYGSGNSYIAHCGTVKDLTPYWHYNSDTQKVEVSFGGTFELYKDDQGNYFSSVNSCTGNIHVTFISKVE